MWKWFAVVAALMVGAALFFALGAGGSGIERAEYSAATRPSVAAGMCSWRDPKADMVAFFPGATGYRADTLVLSRRKVAIENRLGPDYHMDSTALYLYRVEHGGTDMGTVAVRRVSGPHGAIEVVAALDPNHRISGVRIQRMREPETVAKAISDLAWLARFNGLSAATISSSAPQGLPENASDAGQAVNTALRSLLVELDEAEPAPSHTNHA